MCRPDAARAGTRGLRYDRRSSWRRHIAACKPRTSCSSLSTLRLRRYAPTLRANGQISCWIRPLRSTPMTPSDTHRLPGRSVPDVPRSVSPERSAAGAKSKDALRALRGQVLDRGHAAEAVGQALEQGDAVMAKFFVFDVHHHLIEERIHLR